MAALTSERQGYVEELKALENLLRSLGVEVHVEDVVYRHLVPFVHNAALRFALELYPLLSSLGLRKLSLYYLVSTLMFPGTHLHVVHDSLRAGLPGVTLPATAVISVFGKPAFNIAQLLGVEKFMPSAVELRADLETCKPYKLVLWPSNPTELARHIMWTELEPEKRKTVLELLPETAKLLLELLPQLSQIARRYV